MTAKLRAHYLLGVLMVVGGGAVAKYLDSGAGAALVGAGAFWFGYVQQSPRFANRERAKAQGVIPDKEVH